MGAITTSGSYRFSCACKPLTTSGTAVPRSLSRGLLFTETDGADCDLEDHEPHTTTTANTDAAEGDLVPVGDEALGRDGSWTLGGRSLCAGITSQLGADWRCHKKTHSQLPSSMSTSYVRPNLFWNMMQKAPCTITGVFLYVAFFQTLG